MEWRDKKVLSISDWVTLIGALCMLVGVFLKWVGAFSSMMELFPDNTCPMCASSFEFPYGVKYLFIVAVLCFVTFAIDSKNVIKGLAITGLGFAGLAIVFNFLIGYSCDYSISSLREGFYICMIGAWFVTIGGLLKARGR